MRPMSTRCNIEEPVTLTGNGLSFTFRLRSAGVGLSTELGDDDICLRGEGRVDLPLVPERMIEEL